MIPNSNVEYPLSYSWIYSLVLSRWLIKIRPSIEPGSPLWQGLTVRSDRDYYSWNWFNASDQHRDNGEPAIIGDITCAIIREYAIDTRRIHVAGLSAGGAMATVMGANYPDLYAAIGIHSGLPYAVAHDMPSAFAAMKNRKIKGATRKAVRPFEHTMPVIVFHGDHDATVDLSNGDLAWAQCVSPVDAGLRSDLSIKVKKGEVLNGRTYTRTVLHDAQGKAVGEKWIVHGAGHGWSGGSSEDSYPEQKGPDATREMLRFFYTHT